MVSVIIPVYNAEAYLEECLDSVANQTLKNIEIICVNDGSTDNSLNILKEYAEKDDRILIINQENQGAGVARNQGIKVAKGNYLSILDADDFFELNMLELMCMNALKFDADVTICRADGYDHSTGDFYDMSWTLKERFLPEKDLFNYKDIKEHIFSFAVGWSWDKLFKSSFVFENDLEFQDLRSTNDMLFVFLALVKARRMTVVHKILAHHRVNNISSLSRTREEDPLCFYDAVKALKEELIKSNLFSEVEPSFINWSLHFCFWHMDTNRRGEYIESELNRKIFKELEYYKYPKSYFHNKNDYNRLMNYKKSSDPKFSFRNSLKRKLSLAYILKKEKLNLKNIYKVIKVKKQIKSLDLFDENYYLTEYPDVKNSNINPLDHYIYHGWKENRTPTPQFNGKYYLSKYPDVRESNVNPLVHYVLHGKINGRFPNKNAEINSPQKRIKRLENNIKFHNYLYELDKLDTKERTIKPFLYKIQWELNNAEINNELDYSLLNSDEKETLNKIIKDPNTYYIKKYVPEEKYEEYLAEWYINRTGNKLDLKNPTTFNEKIQWIKLYDSTLLKTELTDKYLAREWIKEKIGEEYLIPLLGVYDSFDEIDFDKLPDKFVIKTNHGCSMNIIVKNKDDLDVEDAGNKINTWLNKNYACHFGLELQYKHIKPKILIEEYIGVEDRDTEDYKILCFHGKPEFGFVDHDRYTYHKRNVYDLDYNLLPVKIDHPIKMRDSNFIDEKPKTWDKMIELSEILSQGFIFVRVDFYSANDKIYFGEMTFTPGSGTSIILPDEFYRKVGDLIKLPVVPKVSVIIPVHNMEDYLKECLDSVVNQTLEEIEIICVDDGSTDGSSEILEEFARKDDRINVITQENQGAGVARNTGLKVARGEYLSFLDADDFFEADMLENIYHYSRNNSLDMLVCGFNTFNQRTSQISKIDHGEYLPGKDIFNYKDFSNYVFNTFKTWTGNKLFKRSFILENQIKFHELSSANDLIFTYKALVKADKISTIEVPLIYHRIEHDSPYQNFNDEYPLAFYHELAVLKDFLGGEGIFQDVEQSFVNFAAGVCLNNLHSLKNKESYEKLHNFLNLKGLDELSISGRPDNYFYKTDNLEIKKIEKHPLKPSNKPKVSIIIPIFTVEMYLRECLNSVVNQTLQDIEIICVDDGSTDGSLSILEEYGRKDKRIKIISKPNAGYGHSMNVGMDAATGEYIGIVEPDDYVALDMYGSLYIEAIEHDVDFIKADSYRFDGSRTRSRKNLTNNQSYYNRLVNPQEDLEPFKFMMNTWTGIYKRDFLEKYNIRHNETPGASFQDNGFYFQTFCRATKTYFLNKAFYWKRLDNPNSSVNDRGKVFAMSVEYDYIRDFLEDNPELKKKFIYIYQLKRFHNYRFNLRRISPEFYEEFLEKFHEDYVLAAKNNELDKKSFTDNEWDFLQLLIKDPTDVYELYYKKDDLTLEKSRFNQILTFAYVSKKEKLNPKNIYMIYKAMELIKSLNLFDEGYYLTENPHIRKSYMDPLVHYIYHGWNENRIPSVNFDGNYYLNRYLDVKKSSVSPLVHYVLHGKNEGRFPHHQAEINSSPN